MEIVPDEEEEGPTQAEVEDIENRRLILAEGLSDDKKALFLEFQLVVGRRKKKVPAAKGTLSQSEEIFKAAQTIGKALARSPTKEKGSPNGK